MSFAVLSYNRKGYDAELRKSDEYFFTCSFLSVELQVRTDNERRCRSK